MAVMIARTVCKTTPALLIFFLIFSIVKHFELNEKLYQLLIEYNVHASVRGKKFFCYVRMCVLAQRSTITALALTFHLFGYLMINRCKL